MSTIFAGIPGVVIFLDNIVVHGATPAIHDQRLTRVLENGEKCIFSASEVELNCLLLALSSPVQATGLCASTGGTRDFTSTISHYSTLSTTVHYSTTGRENVVTDLLSRSTPPPAVALNPDNSDLDLIQLLHSPLEATVSLQEPQQASEQDPVLSQLRTFIHSGRPPASSLPDSLAPFHRFKD